MREMNLMETIREKPLSSALVGLGIGWALAGGLRSMRGSRGMSEWEEGMGGTSEEMKAKMQEYRETAREKAEEVRHHAMQWGSQAMDYMKENPFLVVGAALAIGAAVGLGASYMSRGSESEEMEEDVFFCATCGAPLESETGAHQTTTP